jgi:hypothetical protein
MITRIKFGDAPPYAVFFSAPLPRPSEAEISSSALFSNTLKTGDQDSHPYVRCSEQPNYQYICGRNILCLD